MDERKDDDIDITRHLLEVENEAEAMVAGAEREADSIIAGARAEAEDEFRRRYADSVRSLEAKEQEAREACRSDHDRQLEDYRQALRSSRKDAASFNGLLEKLLYA